jgi:hypothetical protein
MLLIQCPCCLFKLGNGVSSAQSTQQNVFQYLEQRVNDGRTEHPSSILTHFGNQRPSLFSMLIAIRAPEQMCRVYACCILRQGLSNSRLEDPTQKGLRDSEEDKCDRGARNGSIEVARNVDRVIGTLSEISDLGASEVNVDFVLTGFAFCWHLKMHPIIQS